MPFREKLPNQMFYLGLVTLEDVLGNNGLKSILNYSGFSHFIDNPPPNNLEKEHTSDDFIRMITGIVNVLGEKGARMILFQAGIRSFEIMLDKFPALFNIEGIEPKERNPERMFEEFKRIYQIIVDALVGMYGDIYKFYECDEGVALEIAPCLWCQGLKTEGPICMTPAGFEFAAAKWILGQEIKVEETHCIAKGDDMCRMVMHRPEV